MLSSLTCTSIFYTGWPAPQLRLPSSLPFPIVVPLSYFFASHPAGDTNRYLPLLTDDSLPFYACSRALGKLNAISFCLMLHAVSIIALGKCCHARVYIQCFPSFLFFTLLPMMQYPILTCLPCTTCVIPTPTFPHLPYPCTTLPLLPSTPPLPCLSYPCTPLPHLPSITNL
jgi:hypothetical protein